MQFSVRLNRREALSDSRFSLHIIFNQYTPYSEPDSAVHLKILIPVLRRYIRFWTLNRQRAYRLFIIIEAVDTAGAREVNMRENSLADRIIALWLTGQKCWAWRGRQGIIMLSEHATAANTTVLPGVISEAVIQSAIERVSRKWRSRSYILYVYQLVVPLHATLSTETVGKLGIIVGNRQNLLNMLFRGLYKKATRDKGFNDR